ncbi:MAG: hypothetical protein A2X23_02180 [Chloroflexi bacterium GWC2_73_18]|nr:MAG: hypothetical protein A2X23_02180 [Chloroflexi bacterium GWC2_73_18]
MHRQRQRGGGSIPFSGDPAEELAPADRPAAQLGDLVSGQERAVVLKLNFPCGEVGRERAATVSLGDRESAFDGWAVTVRWTYAPDRDNDAQPRDRVADRAVAAIYAARARQEAVRPNRLGDFASASAAAEAVAGRIRRYAGEDPGLRAIIRELEEERADWLAPVPEAVRKQATSPATG